MIEALRRRFPEVAELPPGCRIVGGAIRDLLMGLESADVDLAADRARDRAEQFARQTGGTLVPLGGERFPTFRVVVAGRVYDFTDIRGGSIGDDLRRRDFTINAIALDGDTLLDPHDGAGDIERRLIRMIREENFLEDPLRMLKAVRLAVQLDFSIERETMNAIQAHAPELVRVAPERVTHELNLILAHFDRPYGVGLLAETGLDRSIFREALSAEAVESIARIEDDDPIVAYAILLREADVDAHARRWRWSEEDRLAVNRLRRAATDDRDLSIRLYDAGREASVRLPRFLRARGRENDAEHVDRFLRLHAGEVFDLVPLLTGDEVQRLLGIPPGKEVGRIKRALVEAQLRGAVTTREEAENFVRGSV